MRTRAKLNSSDRIHRGGFTLIELMVVITIIAALMALTASAVMKFIAVQQTTNTQSTLDRVQSQLARAWSKVKDQAYSEQSPLLADTSPTGIRATLAAVPGEPPDITTGRVRVIYMKLKLRAAFPMNFAEALNVPYFNPTLGVTVPSSPVPASPAYTSYLASHGILAPAVSAQAAPDPRESAVCLMMALQNATGGAGINATDLTAGGAAGDFNGMPYLTDAWGRPIFFARNPTGSQILNPAGPLQGANDPGDPQGYLNTPTWQTVKPKQQLFSILALQALAPPSNPPLSYKLAPMIASGGPSDWTKLGLTINPITFAPAPTGTDALFSTP